MAAVTVTASGITLTVQDRSVAPDGTAVVTVQVAGAQDLGGIDLVVGYDPSVLRFESAATGSLADRARVSVTQSEPGRVHLAVASPRTLSGNGPLVTLTFAAVGPAGARSGLDLSAARAVTIDGEYVPVSVVNGTVSVGGGGLLPLSPLGAVAAICTAAAVVAASRTRRA